MSFLETFPKTPSPDEILAGLRKFGHLLKTRTEAAHAHRRAQAQQAHGHGRSNTNEELQLQNIEAEGIRTGLWLMRHLPVSRDAVFDYISSFYQDFVQKYLSYLEAEDSIPSVSIGSSITVSSINADTEAFLADIHGTCLLYLESCGDVWSPILSTWTLQLLGQISAGNSGRLVFSRVTSVNELITIWLGSKAIQSLLSITAKCLTMNASNTDSFIGTLLDTSAEHSPHFDWVVAHVGNSYPQTVVNEVLALGLSNFSSNPPQASKLSSVAGILGHLSTTHGEEVRVAMDKMLMSVFSSTSSTAEKYAIPYLLQLCSSSVPLLDVLMDSVLPKITEEKLTILSSFIPTWVQLHFGGNLGALVALVTHLILKSTRGPYVLEILMKGCKKWNSEVIQHKAFTLLGHFTIEISNLLYESSVPTKELVTNFPCIASLKENFSILITFLTDPLPGLARTAKQLVKLISFYEGEIVGTRGLVHYFLNTRPENEHLLWNLINLNSSLEMKYPEILGSVLRTIIVESKLHRCGGAIEIENSLRPWKNILRLVKTENQRNQQQKKLPGSSRLSLSQVIKANLSSLVSILDSRKFSFSLEESTTLVEILCSIPNISNSGVPFGVLLKLERFLVEMLFKLFVINGTGTSKVTKKVASITNICQLLSQLVNSQPALQNDALRSLVQTCLNPDCQKYFLKRNKKLQGQIPVLGAAQIGTDGLLDDDEFEPERFTMYASLLNENQKRSACSVSLTRNLSTSIHSGKFGGAGAANGNLSIAPKVLIEENPDWKLNVQLLLGTILNVCMEKNNGNQENEPSTSASGSQQKKGGKKTGKHARHPHSHAELNPSISVSVSIEAMRKVALLLVEIVSPDVMFNGLPWPEEDFAKIQVERDLQIRKTFDDHPYLWNLLELVANYCPSLCYCSVLLRALLATYIAHWVSCQKTKASSSQAQLRGTIRLLQIMKTGQLLPPPLSEIGLLLPGLKASEVLILLRDIWNYMRVHVPVPTNFIKDPHSPKFVRDAEFLRVDPIFTEKLRLTIINNVEGLGSYYPKLFPPNNLNGFGSMDQANGVKIIPPE